METVAVIPARAGSKGIPRKNVVSLCGRPLVAWSIEAAHRARSVDRVVVSTDDPEIAAISRAHRAEVSFRPPQISGDLASSESALLHTLEQLRDKQGYDPDLLVFLQCTSPLTVAEDIDGTVDCLLADQAQTAVAVVDFHYFLWQPSESGLVGINHDKRKRLPRQQRAPNYLESGAVYVMDAAGFQTARARFFGKTAHYIMPAERCWEIDEPIDLKVAEVLLRAQLEQRKFEALPDPIRALIFDFDGVFTDNRALVLEDGREAVICSRSDGMGVARLKRFGIPLLVLSSEKNPVVGARCHKLGLPCLQGVDGKWSVLHRWLVARKIDAEGVVYVGNDVNDLECIQRVGCGVVVADAHPDIVSSARLILSSAGGHGAIRELTCLIEKRTQLGRGSFHAASA